MSFGANESGVQNFNQKNLKDKTTGETHIDGGIILQVLGITNHILSFHYILDI
jgi:hypothetical protein